MGVKDQEMLCVLLYLCNGTIYQWKRLKIAVYALSEGGRKEGKKWDSLFSYKFENWCYLGPNDQELWRDLIALKFNDYIEFGIDQKPYEMTSHSLYRLKEKGVLEAKSTITKMEPAQLELLEDVAEDLKNDKCDAFALFSKYAMKLQEERLPIVTAIYKEVRKELPALQAAS